MTIIDALTSKIKSVQSKLEHYVNGKPTIQIMVEETLKIEREKTKSATIEMDGDYEINSEGRLALKTPKCPIHGNQYVALAGNYAYVVDKYNGLVIVNVSNPASPFSIKSYTTTGNSSKITTIRITCYNYYTDIRGVAVAGNYAYVADGSNGLEIFRIGDAPSNSGDVNGTDTVSIYRPSTNVFFLRNRNSEGNADLTIGYGTKGDIPVLGDWDGQ